MPGFQGWDFEIELPAGCVDESTYAFVVPGRGNFKPSVVVKTHRLAEPKELPAYVEEQLAQIAKALPEVGLVSKGPVKHGEFPAYTAVYDWGKPGQRVRQKQRYVQLTNPLRIVTITATNLREHFDQSEAMFDAILRSYVPKEQREPGR